MDVRSLIAHRSLDIDASGIRRVFRLGAKMPEKVDLSIGQPHFPVPDAIKAAAVAAIQRDDNRYSQTEGVPALRQAIAARVAREFGPAWSPDLRSLDDDADPARPGVIVTAGTSGALMLAFIAMLDPGDEVIMADPYFVMYPSVLRLLGAHARLCDTYPDFRLTAERVERLINPRTKMVLLNSPGNPSGVVTSGKDCRELLELCRRRNLLLVSDEIYDEFTFADAREPSLMGPRCPSPAREAGSQEDVLVIRGFGKTYGATGWRLGYAVGPRALIEEMSKIQQYTFVCAPTPLQHAVAAFDDASVQKQIDAMVTLYAGNRDRAFERLTGAGYEMTRPGGAFYAFPRIPARLGVGSREFFERCRENKVLIVPGREFSKRDTNIRLSLATSPENLERGLDVLVRLAGQ